MALEEYKRKRDFKKTAEPKPGRIKKSGRALSYLIQKHDATRLHYDFRLELDGVLLSWAVTRGPSWDSKDKRLAVRTEDHPLAYGDFEGTIPQGEYGGGTVMLWDKGEWEPVGDPHDGLKKGNLKFILKGQRLQGHWVLVRMHTPDKRENWLLIKEKDEFVLSGPKNIRYLDDNAFSITTGRRMEAIAGGDAVWHSRPKSAVAESKPGPRTKIVKATTAKKKKSAVNIHRLTKDYPSVQLATLVDAPPASGKWLHEVKFDGYRLLGYVADGKVALKTRNGHLWTEKFPAIHSALSSLECTDAVIDMEAVVLNADGKTNFQALQAALKDGGDRAAVVAYAFDILHLNGESLINETLVERKTRLKTLIAASGGKTIHYSDHVIGQGAEMIAQSCGMGLEGIISKEANAPYRAGRQKSWLKSKCIKRQEFIILGAMQPRSGNRAIGALYLGYYQAGIMRYAGKVGTGFTMKSAMEISKKLEKLAIGKPVLKPDEMKDVPKSEVKSIFWVKPKLLCEVAFTEWTDEAHIRHPSFQGLREDKEAKDVTMEKPVSALKAAKQAERSIEAKPHGQKKSSPLKTKPAAKIVAAKKSAKTGTSLILHGVEITHPDREISGVGHVTKGRLAEYYAAVAPLMLASIARRPISLLRCPAGIGEDCFYQRNPGRGLGSDIHLFKFRHKGKNYEYLYIENEKGLMQMVQMGAIEIHPWGAGISTIDYPDRMIFDLDPAPDVSFEAVKLGALDLRARLEKMGLKSFVKCTGGKGLHVTVPLAGKNKWPEVRKFAENLAQHMVSDVPEAYVATMTKAKRNGKIFIDFFRNDYTATAVADYSPRARDGTPVALPLEWSDLKNLKSGNAFDIDRALKFIKKRPPDRRRYKIRQVLPKS